jgi:hypothetical protein
VNQHSTQAIRHWVRHQFRYCSLLYMLKYQFPTHGSDNSRKFPHRSRHWPVQGVVGQYIDRCIMRCVKEPVYWSYQWRYWRG